MLSLSSLQISLKMWTGKGWTCACAHRDLILENKTKNATCISKNFAKTVEDQCLRWEGWSKDAGETHTLLRDVLGSPCGLPLSCSPPQEWGSLHIQHLLSTSERLVVLKKKTKLKHNTLYWNKEAGFVPEDVTLRNATEDSNPIQAS